MSRTIIRQSISRAKGLIGAAALAVAIAPLMGGCPWLGGDGLAALFGRVPTKADGMWRVTLTSAPANGEQDAINEDFGDVEIVNGLAESARSPVLGYLSGMIPGDPNSQPVIIFDGRDAATSGESGFTARFSSSGSVRPDGKFQMTWIIEEVASGPYAVLLPGVLFEMRMIFEGQFENDDLITGTMRFEYEVNPTLSAFFDASNANPFSDADALFATPMPFRMERLPAESESVSE